ncbi:hypothetical protein FDZ73_23860, partial [bacterium]
MINAGTAFDPDQVNIFIQGVALYPEGTIVRMNTGETAVIAKSYRDYPTRPRVRILTDKQGRKKYGPTEVIELS